VLFCAFWEPTDSGRGFGAARVLCYLKIRIATTILSPKQNSEAAIKAERLKRIAIFLKFGGRKVLLGTILHSYSTTQYFCQDYLFLKLFFTATSQKLVGH